jgi:hypothetical protein
MTRYERFALVRLSWRSHRGGFSRNGLARKLKIALPTLDRAICGDDLKADTVAKIRTRLAEIGFVHAASVVACETVQ